MLSVWSRIQEPGFRSQDSGVRKNFNNASAGASGATNSFAPLEKVSLRKAKGKTQ
jgi:hypothetical protein